MFPTGLTVDQLARELARLSAAGYGKLPVFAGGEDYPGPVSGVVLEARGDAYVKAPCAVICTHE